MTTCPGCGRPVPAGALVCPSCGATGPTLPDGLFRDEPVAAEPLDQQQTAAFTPDFLRDASEVQPTPPSTAPAGPPAPQQAPGLPDDLFRSDTPTAIRTPLLPVPPDPGLASEPPVHAAVPRPSLEPEPVWLPLAAPGTPEGDLLPSERPPEEPPPARTGSVGWMLVVLAALLVTAVVGGMLWWESGPVPPATTATRSTRPSGSASRSPSAAESAPSSPAAPTSTQPPAFPPRGASPCNATVAVNEVTSCAFALNVAAALKPIADGASQSLTATSPTTGQTYQMTCRRNGYVTCTGGVNATVYVKVDA